MCCGCVDVQLTRVGHGPADQPGRWDERFTEELDRSRRKGASLSVVMIDIDGFKAVNDRLGDGAGDQLLVDIANAWKLVLRASGDFLARLGWRRVQRCCAGCG